MKYAAVILLAGWAVACQAFTPKSGDLLFQIGKGSGFEKAVAAATSARTDLPFTHVGVAEKTLRGAFVWEASPSGGVRRVPLADFLADAAVLRGHPAVVALRLKRRYRKGIPAALERLRALEGRPYDFLFQAGNDAYYCSELVQTAFVDAAGRPLFESFPMNFNDLSTGEPSSFWTEYFGKRGASVPQGEPGTNPADLSKSALLKRVYRYFK